jgi:hypothetical protein
VCWLLATGRVLEPGGPATPLSGAVMAGCDRCGERAAGTVTAGGTMVAPGAGGAFWEGLGW